jgi:arylsulfatase A-like enzyme
MSEPSRTPNIVIIMTDEQKRSSLSVYANPVCRTPNLDRLAESGQVFDHAYASCPLCVPSRVSLMTGRYAHVTGSRTNAFLKDPREACLLWALQDCGYATGLSGKNHCFTEEELSRFDFLWQAGHLGPVDPPDETAREAKAWVQSSGVGQQAWGAATNPYPAESLGTALTTDNAIRFVDEHRHDPFCLWYSIADPHTPLQTAEPYARMYDPDAVDLPPIAEGEIATKPPAQQIDFKALAGEGVTEPIMRRAIAMYYGMNSYIDAQVGRFMDHLEALDLRNDTIIVYLSDHGDYMGEHRMIRKSKALYDCLCRIPLIVSWPGSLPGGGRRHDAFVVIEDLLPTLFDLAGVGIPAGVQGMSFAPLLRGEEYPARDCVFGEIGIEGTPYPVEACTVFPEGPLTKDFTPRNKLGGKGRIRSVRTREWKLVHYPGQPYGELYHLPDDPWELCNRYGEPALAEITNRLRARLLDWCIETDEVLPTARRDIVDG